MIQVIKVIIDIDDINFFFWCDYDGAMRIHSTIIINKLLCYSIYIIVIFITLLITLT